MITYYLVAPFLYLLAYLPTAVLYRLADVIAFVLRVVIGYRKKVVFTNLRNSFPEKSDAEIQTIAKEFYTHLADRIVENIRCIAISKEEIAERLVFKNTEVLHEVYASGRHAILMIAHVAAWEFSTYTLSIISRYKLFAITSRVHNPYFDSLIHRTRGKMGMKLIHMQDSGKFFRERQEELSLTVFVSDQSPSNKEKAYWTNFLNQDTGFFRGGERYATAHNCVVLYPILKQTSRGYYDIEFIKITDEPTKLKPGEITERFVKLLQQQIRNHPADWLWSHKRWKHKRSTKLEVGSTKE